MAFEINGKVGPGYAGDGSLVDPRMTKDLATVTQDLHSRLYETTYRGNTFIACTGVAGVAPGTALSTTPPFTLYNPIGSGVNLVLFKTSMGYISGTMGAGTVYYAVNNNTTQAAPSGGTALTPICSLIGNASLPHGKAFQGATLAATPTIFKDFAAFGAILATSVFAPTNIFEIGEGTMIVMPGAALSLQAVATAGTTPLVTFAMTWEEVPV